MHPPPFSNVSVLFFQCIKFECIVPSPPPSKALTLLTFKFVALPLLAHEAFLVWHSQTILPNLLNTAASHSQFYIAGEKLEIYLNPIQISQCIMFKR